MSISGTDLNLCSNVATVESYGKNRIKDAISNDEQKKFNKFQAQKAFGLNFQQGAWLTGWVGAILGGLAATVDDHKVDVDEETATTLIKVGFEITALPGRGVGLLASPARIIHTLRTRNLIYSDREVKEVCNLITKIMPQLKSLDEGTECEIAKAFLKTVEHIIDRYGPVKFSQSISSGVLRDALSKNAPLEDAATKLITYLSETEVPIALPIFGWKADEYSKNQGKRLFNIIMDEFLKLTDMMSDEINSV